MSLQFKTTLLVAASLAVLASGLPGRPRDGALRRLRRQSEAGNAEQVNSLISGLIYSRNILLSLSDYSNYSILPIVNTIPKRESKFGDEIVSSTYKALVSALDKVLRLYDFQAKLHGNHIGDQSVEVMALQVVVDGLVNQTCDWIQSLGVSYSGTSEQFVCSEAGLRKLHALTSAWVLFNNTFNSAIAFVNNFTVNRTWSQDSGVRERLGNVFSNTVYIDLLIIPK